MSVTRVTLGNEKLVYVLLADRQLRYLRGWSRVAYVGTTKNGVSRIAGSVAARSAKILRLHGVNELQVRILTCRPRQRVKTWRKLERGVLLAFRDTYGEVPRCNGQGRRMKETDEFEYFRKKRIQSILRRLE
jgi:hypothetical protein